MDKINVFHGIYDIIFNTPYHIEGFFHEESREYMPMSNKLRAYLNTKGLKFNGRLGINYLYFTLARDPMKDIEAIGICHPKYDVFQFEIGENVAVGRIKRMRGDLKKTIYEMEHYTETLYYKDAQGIPIRWKEIPKKRVKLNYTGDPIVKKRVFFEPYNLDKRYRIHSKKHKRTIAGELMYPYIYKMVGQ